MEVVPFDSGRWSWGGVEPEPVEYRGQRCIRLGSPLATVSGLDLEDGAIDVELAVGAARGFHGVVWRVQDGENYESFFVRPHQVGNPDSIQYTPVCNDVSAWQLYHGEGFWAPISFPLDDWFRIRVVFAGRRAEVFVGDLDAPALVIGALRQPVLPGGVGLLVGGPAIHVRDFRVGLAAAAQLVAPEPPPTPAAPGVVSVWEVSDAFSESDLPHGSVLDDEALAARTWTRLAAEPSGLANLARVNGVRDDRNTVFARTIVRTAAAQTKELRLGFSDRAVVYLNGRALYRGDDTYRSRDYRYLGSIGWYDTLYLPLRAGDNQLVVAVSEDFGGWGVQARFTAPGDLGLG